MVIIAMVKCPSPVLKESVRAKLRQNISFPRGFLTVVEKKVSTFHCTYHWTLLPSKRSFEVFL